MRTMRNLAGFEYYIWTTSTQNFSFLAQFLVRFSPPGYPFFGNSLFLKIHISEFRVDIRKSFLSDLGPCVGNLQKKFQVWDPFSFPGNGSTNLNQLLGISPRLLGIPGWNYHWICRFGRQLWYYLQFCGKSFSFPTRWNQSQKIKAVEK